MDHRRGRLHQVHNRRVFDLILLIYGDFGALSPTQRQVVLKNAARQLAPGGRLVFDVFSAASFDSHDAVARYEAAPEGGFWAAGPYFLFTNSFNYSADLAYLDRYTIIEPHRQRELFNWNQCFDPPRLRTELAAAGWAIEAFPGNLAGDSYDPENYDFGVVAEPKE